MEFITARAAQQIEINAIKRLAREPYSTNLTYMRAVSVMRTNALK